MHHSFRRPAVVLITLLCSLALVHVVLAASPAGDFTISDDTPQIGQTVTFEATGLADEDGGTPTDITWDLGDGEGATGITASHMYGNAGDKTVTMTIADPEAADPPTTVTHTLHVNAPPTASIQCTPSTVAQNEATSCDGGGSTDPEAGALSYAWDKDGDGFDDGSDSTEVFFYSQPGTQTIRLRVTDSQGAMNTTQQEITVSNGTPIAALGITPNPARIDQMVNFNASNSRDPGGSIVSYQWDLDGNPSTGPNGGFEVDTGTDATTNRSYASANSYPIRLRVVDNNGGSAIDSETLHIFGNVPPSVSASAAPNPAQIGQTVNFSSSANDTDGTITGYEWDLDGDGTFDPGVTSANPSRSYATAGVRTIKVRVTDNDGAKATDVFPLRINARPTPSFTITPNPALIREAIQLDATSSSDFDGSITNYEWDFNYNGSTFTADDTGVTTTTSYDTAGNKTIALRVTDNDNATGVWSRVAVVQLTRPHAVFGFSPQAPLPGQAVEFTSQSAASGSSGAQITNTEWDFDYNPTKDFTTDATGATATTSFASPGPKTVAIRVTETGGGFAVASGTVVVNAPPQASFNVSPGTLLDGDTVTLSSTSGDPDGPLASQQWDLDGDGQYDDASGAVATRRLPKGSHRVGLRVTDSRGAVATAERRMTVLARPLKLLEGVKITLFGNLTREGARLARLFVRTPARATVKITCKGKSCPKSTTRKRAAKTQRLRFKKFERLFPGGTLITVSVTRSGYIGQQTTIKVRDRLRRYIRRDRCIQPAGKPIACPDS
jgi:hypothetical protein